jgi:GNAT superfamily N-acetyltransferase
MFRFFPVGGGIAVTLNQGQYFLTNLTPKAKEIIKTAQWVGNWWQLQSLVVTRRDRGQGYGHILLQDVKDRSAGMNCHIILAAHPYANSWMTSDRLVLFYEKHGFERVHVTARDPWMVWRC